jgi:hypothetical protein
MAAVNQVTIFPNSNSVKFAPANPLYYVLGQAPYGQTIQDWQEPLKYSQKVLNTDQLAIMVHYQYDLASLGSYIKLYVCDQYQNIITGITATLNTYPYRKGNQHIAGNNFTDPYTSIVTPLYTSLYVFNFEAFYPTYITYGQTYFLRLDNVSSDGTIQTFYSEPLYVATSHKDTLLIQYSYNSNIANKNIVTTGWFNNSGHTSPYNPVFSLRLEGYISDLNLKVINIGYLQQQYNQNQIKTEQRRTWQLCLGEISIGIPYYLLEMATEAMLADNIWINSYGYILFNPQGVTQLSDLWKKRDSINAPLVYASAPIMERYPEQQALQTTIPSHRIFTGQFTAPFD